LFTAADFADLNKRRNFPHLHQRLFSRAKTPRPPGAQRLHAVAALTEKPRAAAQCLAAAQSLAAKFT
jgi:hypothetical protein